VKNLGNLGGSSWHVFSNAGARITSALSRSFQQERKSSHILLPSHIIRTAPFGLLETFRRLFQKTATSSKSSQSEGFTEPEVNQATSINAAVSKMSCIFQWLIKLKQREAG
jgi:hypothetical protein